jgi:hypothetical protein
MGSALRFAVFTTSCYAEVAIEVGMLDPCTLTCTLDDLKQMSQDTK